MNISEVLNVTLAEGLLGILGGAIIWLAKKYLTGLLEQFTRMNVTLIEIKSTVSAHVEQIQGIKKDLDCLGKKFRKLNKRKEK